MRAYEALLRGELGYSGYRIRRLKSRAVRLARRLLSRARVLVGGHACVEYDRRRRRCERGRFYPWEEFSRLAMGEEGLGRKFREFGVDVVVCPDGGSAAGGDAGAPEELRELEELVLDLYEVLGSARVYVPVTGEGSRKHRG